MTPPPRSMQLRKRDTLHRLEHDVDLWVASADPETGTPYLIPLSFLWDGDAVVVATPATSPTSRNLRAAGKVRLGVGLTRDVVIIEGTVQVLAPAADISAEIGDAFAVRTGFDPRTLSTSYLYFRIQPQRIQAWREANELAGRELMRAGRWTVPNGAGDSPAAPTDTPEPAELSYDVHPVGWVESALTDQGSAPRQGDEGAPSARVVFRPELSAAAADLQVGAEVLVLTWLHQASRDVLSVHPRDDLSRPREGVFSTRSSHRPNPIGLHPATITDIEGSAITVDRLEAIDGTPVLDVKPILRTARER